MAFCEDVDTACSFFLLCQRLGFGLQAYVSWVPRDHHADVWPSGAALLVTVMKKYWIPDSRLCFTAEFLRGNIYLTTQLLNSVPTKDHVYPETQNMTYLEIGLLQI